MNHLSALLEQIAPEYPRISEAPDASELERRANQRGVSLKQILAEERHVDYKSIDSHGNVWLIKNPAAWNYDGRQYIRPNPVLYAAADKRRGSKKQSTELSQAF